MLSEDTVVFEDASPEAFSTLEALDDIAVTVESIVLSLGGEQERDAYLAAADEYETYADSLADEPGERGAEVSARLSELEERMADAFQALLKGCPAHIRTLHDAIRAAVDAEEEAEAA